MVVFEGMSDMLAYIQAGKDKGLEKETQRLICLNSVTNVQKFIEQFQDYKGEMELCLDADEAGEKQQRNYRPFSPRRKMSGSFSEYTRAGEERRILMKG